MGISCSTPGSSSISPTGSVEMSPYTPTSVISSPTILPVLKPRVWSLSSTAATSSRVASRRILTSIERLSLPAAWPAGGHCNRTGADASRGRGSAGGGARRGHERGAGRRRRCDRHAPGRGLPRGAPGLPGAGARRARPRGALARHARGPRRRPRPGAGRAGARARRCDPAGHGARVGGGDGTRGRAGPFLAGRPHRRALPGAHGRGGVREPARRGDQDRVDPRPHRRGSRRGAQRTAPLRHRGCVARLAPDGRARVRQRRVHRVVQRLLRPLDARLERGDPRGAARPRAGAARDRRLERRPRPARRTRSPAAPARGAGRRPAGGDDGPAPPRAGRGEDHLRHLRDARPQRRRRAALVDARRLPARPLAAGGRAHLLPRGHRHHGRRGDHLAARRPRRHPRRGGERGARRQRAGRRRRVGRARLPGARHALHGRGRARRDGRALARDDPRARRARGARGHRLALPRGVRRAARRRPPPASRHAARRRGRGEERRPPPAAGGRPRPSGRASGRPRGGRARRRVAGRARHRRVGRDGRSPCVLAARAAVRAEARPGGARGALRRLAAPRERRPGDALVTLAEQLGREAVGIRDGSLPPDVVARALDLLRDHLGVALGGAGEESSVVLRRGLAALGLQGGATVLGTAERLPAPHAALANGAAAHALEMDDTHQGGSLHLGATVFPAALAAAELVGASGERVLRAAVAGYDVAARLAMALGPAAHYRRGFHLTATCGAFGAAAAAGAVLGLDAAVIAAALGIAGSQAAGSMEFLAGGSWTKRFQTGWAACAGLHAAALAQAGFSGPATILEGRFGFLHAYSDGATTVPLGAREGFELMRTSLKPHACCRYMQGPIDAVLALRAAHPIAPDAVERVEVGMLAAGFPIVCEPAEAKRRPASVVEAQFSLPFGVAVALARGAASPAEFAPACLRDPTVGTLMERVVGVRDPALDAAFPRAWPCWVRITLRGRPPLEAHIQHPRGDPESFLTPAELERKFRTLASRALPAAALARLEAGLADFPRARRVAPLLAAAAPSGS